MQITEQQVLPVTKTKKALKMEVFPSLVPCLKELLQPHAGERSQTFAFQDWEDKGGCVWRYWQHCANW